MSFLSGLAKGLHRAFDGTNLAVAQALLAGDYQAAAALRARQDELQRQNDLRDAQVIGAKNMGIPNDEIGATSPQDLSALARQRALARMFDPAADPDGGSGVGSATDAAPGPIPGEAAPLYAPPPGERPPGVSLTSAPGSAFQAAAFPGARWAQAGAFANLPRARNHAEAAALPKGSCFLAPDASLRRIV